MYVISALFSLRSSRESDSTYKTHQTLDIEYVIDSATFEPGVYEVRVAVVLGDEDSAATGEGLTMTATTTISVSGQLQLPCLVMYTLWYTYIL